MLARNYQPQFQNYHRLTGTNKVYVTGVAKLRRSESLGLWMVLAKVGVAGWPQTRRSRKARLRGSSDAWRTSLPQKLLVAFTLESATIVKRLPRRRLARSSCRLSFKAVADRPVTWITEQSRGARLPIE